MARWYFAWVDETDTAWEETFAREDEEIVSLTRDHAEGDFASLTIDIRNPHVGLLAPGRKLWAWVTYETDAAVVHPFFFGQIVGFPEDVQRELISLLFIAKPVDVVEQKETLAATLRVAPFWDPIFVRPEDIENPDVVLNARPYRWHFDPITHEISISHITVAEDGAIAFGESQVFYDGSSFSYSSAPIGELKLEAKVNWTQRAKGTGVDLKPRILQAFVDAGSSNPWLAQSYTGDGLVGAWPLPGDDMGGGWKIQDTDVNPAISMRPFANSLVYNIYLEEEEDDSAIGAIQVNRTFPQEPKELVIPLSQLDFIFLAEYDGERSRTETISVMLTADVQRLTSEPATLETITIESNDVSEPVDEVDTDSDATDPTSSGAGTPIGDVRRNSYFKTDRGYRSTEYVLAFGGTILLRRARAVELSFRVAFDAGLDVTLRKEVNPLTHRLLPGGVASGKVIATRMFYSADGHYAEITIGCCVGRGGTLEANAGEPTYVDDDYVEEDYQARIGEQRLVLPDLLYTTYDDAPITDDGYNFLSPVTAEQALISVEVDNGPTEQRNILGTVKFKGSQDEIMNQLATIFTRVCVEMRPVTGGPFDNSIEIETEPMLLPRSIDLEEGDGLMVIYRFEFPPAQADPRARLERITRPFEEYKQRRDQALAKLRAPPEEDLSHLYCWGGPGQFTFDDIPGTGVSVKIKDPKKKPPGEEEEEKPDEEKPKKKVLIWNEIARKTSDLRVENPDDSSQYVIIERIESIYFKPPSDEIKYWPKHTHEFQLKNPERKNKNPPGDFSPEPNVILPQPPPPEP